VTDRYLWGPAVDQILADQSAAEGTTLWGLADNQGTIRDVVTDSGSLEQHLAYSPFGQQLTTATDFVFGYTGTYTDPTTGLQLHGVRWYDPTSQRWLTQDPAAADENLYRYCGNGPTDGTDPTGMENPVLYLSEQAAAEAETREAANTLKLRIIQLGLLHQAIEQRIQQIADKIKAADQANKCANLDLTDDLKELRDWSKNYVKLLTDALNLNAKLGGDFEISNKLNSLGVNVGGFNTLAAIDDQADITALYQAGKNNEQAIGEHVATLDGAAQAATVVKQIGEWSGYAATVLTLGASGSAVCLAKTVGGMAAVYLISAGAETTLRALGASEQTISYANAAATVAMFLIAKRGCCFVAGTPVLVPGQPSGAPSAADVVVIDLDTSGRDQFFAAAALLVGIEHLRSSSRKKSRRQRDDEDGIPDGRDNDLDTGASPDADRFSRDGGIRDILLVRPASAPGDFIAAMGSAPPTVGNVRVGQPASRDPGRPENDLHSLSTVRKSARSKSRPNRGMGLGRIALAAVLLVAAVFGVKSVVPGRPSRPPAVSSIAAESGSATRPIESLRVGKRVVSRNPDSQHPMADGETAVDPRTWRDLVLRAELHGPDNETDSVEVETLQPPEWVAEHGASKGAIVPLPFDVIEMGLPGEIQATVVDNQPCPPIQPGEGRVILSTVSHVSNRVGSLTLEDEPGHQETIRPTAFHKFYREPDGKWVSLVDLRSGDVIRGERGALRVVAASVDNFSERVYNITVEGEHVYFVSSLGALAHNADCNVKVCAEEETATNCPKTATPYRDPSRPGYNNGATHLDHTKARSLGGSNAKSNLRPLPAETNLRKGGYEGQLKAYEEYLIRNGMNPKDARSVIQPEIDALGTSPPPRPMDPAVLDQLPANPADQGHPH
jgi:RHS repeat-associated protein